MIEFLILLQNEFLSEFKRIDLCWNVAAFDLQTEVTLENGPGRIEAKILDIDLYNKLRWNIKRPYRLIATGEKTLKQFIKL